MQYRTLGRTGLNVSAVSFGAWAIGGAWGNVDDKDSLAALHRAIDLGVNFIDTADVYGDGRSERLIAQLRKDRPRDTIHVATKAGRRLSHHTAPGYNRENLTCFVDRSLKNLATDALDLLQLHCPPTEVYYTPEVFGILDDLARAGKLRHYGVSVAKVEEALKAIEYPNVKTVQIIFNIFRQRPACPLGVGVPRFSNPASPLGVGVPRFSNPASPLGVGVPRFSEAVSLGEASSSTPSFLDLARRRNIGILARVPLCSGLLTGKMSASTQFADDDHRKFNRHGEQFDRGETFSGIDYDTALAAVEKLRDAFHASSIAGSLRDPGSSPAAPLSSNRQSEEVYPPRRGNQQSTLTQFALRWILMFDAVSCAIPGAKTAQQSDENFTASELPPCSPDVMTQVRSIYDELIAPQVHHRW